MMYVEKNVLLVVQSHACLSTANSKEPKNVKTMGGKLCPVGDLNTINSTKKFDKLFLL